jgi:hypothetical protein
LERWLIAPDGGIQGVCQRAEGHNAEIPIDKTILYRTTRRRNAPTGRALLRSAYRSWYFKRRLEEVEGIGAERDLTGIPKIRVPARVMNGTDDASKAALNDWVRVGEGLRQDETAYVLIPSERDEQGNPLYDVELMGAPGQKTINLSDPINRHATGIAQSILADVITVGHEATGSYSLAATKADLFDAGLQALADGIADTFTRYAIHRLADLNGFNPDLWPTMKAGSVGRLTLGEIATYVKDLAGGAVILDTPELREYLSTKAGLPYAPSEAEEA